jgi:AcrR family transcriptional regulator
VTTASKRWTRKPDERPREILEAAFNVFADKGLRAATMQEIAEAASITKGTIYLYFESKEALFVETVRAQFEEIEALFPAIALEPNTDPEQQMRVLGRAFLDVVMTPKVARTIPLVIAEYNRLPVLKELYLTELIDRLDGPVAAYIAVARQAGVLRDIDPHIAARLVLGSFLIFVLTQEVLCAKERTPMERDAIADTVATVLFRGLMKDSNG